MPARAAIARLDDCDTGRASARLKCDQLLQHLAATAMAASASDFEIRRSERSAPQIFYAGKPSPCHASTSHSGHWVAAGVAVEANIGVDIQIVSDRQRHLAIAKMLRLDYDASDEQQMFFRRWGLREAIAKSTGSSVLTKHEIEIQLGGACDKPGTVIHAAGFTALIDTIATDVSFAFVVRNRHELQHCA